MTAVATTDPARPTLSDEILLAPPRWKRIVQRIDPAVRLVQLGMVVAILLVWETTSGNPHTGSFVLIDEFYVGRPSKAWNVLVEWAGDGTLAEHSLVTLKEALLGFAIGCLSGMVVGFTLGVNRLMSRIFNPFVMAMYAVPKLALTPLFILWFGFGIESKVALVVIVVFFLVFFNTYSGAREVDRDLVNVLRVMSASSWLIHRRVTIPSAASWVIAGLRVSVPYAFVAAVVGEMTAAQQGLGMLIQRASTSFNPSAMFAAIGVLVVLSFGLNALVSVVERIVLRWRIDPGGPHVSL